MSPAIIVVVWLTFFSSSILVGRVFFYRDLFFMHEPLRRYWTSVVSAGNAPFLNTALNLGEPILANPINAALYPGNLVYFVLPFGTAWNLILAGHVLWAALGVYWLARKLDCAGPSALTGALVFGFCGPVVSSLNYYNLLVATSWIPWAAGFALLAWSGSWIWAAATALALAMQILAGEPTIVGVTAGLLACGYGVALLRNPSRYRAVFARGLFIAAVAFLLASVQILPTALWLPHSGRAGGLPFRESAAYWSLHPARLAELLVPHIYGNPAARLAADFWGAGYSDSGLPLIMKLYAGWIPLLLLPLALRRSLGRWAALVFALCLTLSLGHRLVGYHLLYNVFPPLWVVRYPEKFTILGAFALALATSLALPREGPRRLVGGDGAPSDIFAAESDDGGNVNRHAAARTRIVLIAVSAALLALLPLLAFALPHGALSPEQRAQQLRAINQAGVVGAVSCLLLFLATIHRYRRMAAGLIPAVLVLDLASVTWDVAGTRPREESDAKPALLANLPDTRSAPVLHLGEQQSDAYFSTRRDPIQSMQDALHPFTGLRWGVAYGAVDDIDRMGWKVAAARQGLLHQTLYSAPNLGLEGPKRVADALATMRACGIGHIISLAPMTIEGIHEESALSLPNGPTLRVYATDLGPPPFVRFENGDGRLTWKEEAPHRISISVDSPTECTIVVTRNALDGWKASSGGKVVPVSATREGLLRLSVPPGSQHIVLSYTPPGLLLGSLLTAAGLAAISGSTALALRTHRSRPSNADSRTAMEGETRSGR